MNICFDVAEYFLANQDLEAEDYVSHMKLQKLCFYAQGCCLAATGEPIFKESIQARACGPVVPELYERYKGFKACLIPKPEASLADISARFSDDKVRLLKEVGIVYGQYSAWKLRDLALREKPWAEAFADGSCAANVISLQSMKDWFGSMLWRRPKAEAKGGWCERSRTC